MQVVAMVSVLLVRGPRRVAALVLQIVLFVCGVCVVHCGNALHSKVWVQMSALMPSTV